LRSATSPRWRTSFSVRGACGSGRACWATTFDPAALETRLVKHERAMQEPGFWDDPAAAARTSAAHAADRARLDEYRRLVDETDDLAELAALSREEERGGEDIGALIAELSGGLDRVEAELERLEEVRLFSGPHDAGD